MNRILGWSPAAAHDRLVEAADAAGCAAVVIDSAGDTLSELREHRWAATVVSLDQPLADESVLRRIAGVANAGIVVLSTRRPTLETAMMARRVGARGVVHEPLAPDALVSFLADVDRSDVVPLETPIDASDIVGASPAMMEVFATVADAATSDSTVLVTGESGTGKEVVARTIHETGTRRSGPFISINCAAIPETLLESELFGHERGAFTGATTRRVGRFERADGGTLFLDEIGDMSPLLQAKVLRVLEERVVDPVGGNEARPVDVRVIAATHQDLRSAIEAGSFREDLYYRLAVFEIDLPPLNEREGDVRLLTMHFLDHFAERHGRRLEGISRKALERLEAAEWPGNVRELRNVIDRAVVMAADGVVRSASLKMGDGSPRRGPRDASAPVGYPVDWSIAQVEAEHIRSVLEEASGQMGRAAEILGIHRNTLTRKLQEYGLTSREKPR